MSEQKVMGAEMSTTEKALRWFDLDSIDGITVDELKRRFKRSLSAHHPDRGGKEGDFEEIIEAYEYLSALIKRLMGGRSERAIIDVADLIKQRDRDFVMEMNNMIADVFDQIDRRQLDDFHITFNQAFQKQAAPLTDDGGYDEWLRSDPALRDYTYKSQEDYAALLQEQIQLRGLGDKEPLDDVKLDIPLPPDFQKEFVSSIRSQYPDRIKESLILHPMEMAIVDGRCYGTDIIRRETSYHSSMYVNPEYVDLMNAYTSDNTVIDKLPEFEEQPLPSIDEIMKEREKVYQCIDNEEMKQVYEYERRYFENEAKQQYEVESYFKSTGSSSWALGDGCQTIYRDMGDEKGME